VIEELAEECHPRIERRRQADIRGRVRNEEDLSVVVGAEDAVETRTHNRSREGIFRGSRDRSRIVFRLVDDQIGDGSWLGIDYGAGISIVRVRAKQRIRQPWERVVRSAELVLTRNQVVELAGDRPQSERHLRVRQDVDELLPRSIPFRDLDLSQNKLEVGANEVSHDKPLFF